MNLSFDIHGLILLLLTATRIGSLFLIAPILGSRHVPFKFRLLLAGFVSLAVFPLVASTAADGIPKELAVPGLVSLWIGELLVGCMLGFGVTVFVTVARTAGSIIGQMAGMQWETEADTESAEPVSAISQLFGMLSVAMFAMIGGPEMALSSIMDSFQHIQFGTNLSAATGAGILGEVLQQSFLLTLRGVGPAMAALLISTIVIGMISRAYPHLSMFGIGFHSNQFVFLMAVLLTMGGCVWLFVDDVDQYMQMIKDRVRGLSDEV